MANKDFFDKEYDKLESTDKQKASDEQFRQWSSAQPPHSEKANNRKPLYISLICLGLVLCIVLGWLLCTIFTDISGGGTEEKILGEVLSVLDNEYYRKVDDTAMWNGIEDAGTALLQTAGDQFSRLMSPATYYMYNNPQSDVGGNSGGVFGMSFQIAEGIGLYVSSITVNSNAYGALQAGDLVVKLTDINSGYGVTVNGVTYTQIVTSDVSSKLMQQLLAGIDSATFSVLRSGDIESFSIKRGEIDYPNHVYPYEFVEFYFNDNLTNISTEPIGGAATCTKDERLLSKLAELPDTGYIRIDQFMNTAKSDGSSADAVSEFTAVMNIFRQSGLKHLILDLKGNPGGRVDFVSKIAGMLITDSKLSSVQQSGVTNRNGETLITYLQIRNGATQKYYAPAHYEYYFGEASSKPSIVVWTDENSASASELLTGALRDYGTAVQMGTTTYGKGIAQTVKELDYQGTFVMNGQTITERWAVYYTVAQYFSPVNNINIHGTGYTPEDPYNGLDTYEKLWNATINYFKTPAGSGGGTLANK